MNSGQHTIKYKTEGDYNHLTPKVSIVEYQNSTKMLLGTCEKCVFNSGKHSLECLWETHKKNINRDCC